MTDSQQPTTVRLQTPPTETMRRFGSMVLFLAALALIGAFIPVFTIVSLITALASLALGILCLVLDRSFNLAALGGTLLASAAVTVSITMGFVYGA